MHTHGFAPWVNGRGLNLVRPYGRTWYLSTKFSTRASAQDRPKVAADLRAMIWLLKFCAAAMAPSVLDKTANNERETVPPLRIAKGAVSKEPLESRSS